MSTASTSTSASKGTKERNINLQAAYLHVLGDLLQSIAVLIAGVIIYIKPDWSIADPICTLIFSVIVFWSTKSVVKSTIMCLMESCPPSINQSEVIRSLHATKEIYDVHNLRIWNVSLSTVHMTLHCSSDCTNIADAMDVIYRVAETYGIDEITPCINIRMSGCEACRRKNV